MPRTPVAATARQDRISARMTEDEVAGLDGVRGPLTRSDFIRALVRDEIARHAALSRKDA